MFERISANSLLLQTLILIAGLLGLLFTRVFIQVAYLDIILIVLLCLVVIILFYLQKERARRAIEKASISIDDAKYAEKLASNIGRADEVLADVVGDMVVSVRGLSVPLDNIVKYIKTIASKSQQISLGTDAQSFSLHETATSIEGISDSIKKLVGRVEKLHPNVEKATSSILDMVDSNKKISFSTQELLSSVRDVSDHIDSMVTSVAGMRKNFGELSDSSQITSDAVERIDSSIKEIESNAKDSFALSELVHKDAELGAAATDKTIEGMERIKEIVVESADVVQRLGEKSGEVGDIINVIDEITDRTNLLALNASIIAAQAGDDGLAFAVVADEIKRLAEQTAQSTVEISDLISGIQSMVEDVVQATEMGKWSAEDGVKVSKEAGEALRKILDSTAKSSEMSRHIADSTEEQSKEARMVLKAIGKEVTFIQSVSKAMDGHAAQSDRIRDVTKRMLSITQDVTSANMEQEKANAYVTRVIEDVKSMVEEMFEIARDQRSDSEQILQAIEIIEYISTENIKAIKDLAEGTDELKGKVEDFDSGFQSIGFR